MKVYCPALLSGRFLPSRFAQLGVKGGENASPPVEWSDIPAGTLSFVLTMIDRHPVARNWLHWCVINLPPSTREIGERASCVREKIPTGALEIRNSYGLIGYGGPLPPKGSGPHSYEIAVHALQVESLELGPFASLGDCTAAMTPHILETAIITGIFEQ